MTDGQLLRNVTVFQQSYSLTNALVEGQEYHVTVLASCSGSAAAVAASQSATVKVSMRLDQHAILMIMNSTGSCQCVKAED